MNHYLLSLASLTLLCTPVLAQQMNNPTSNHGNKFEQLGQMIQDPNSYRSASGAPGPMYWQQKADYEIDVEVDDVNQRIIGSETVTYWNNSPDPLTYLWLQLDENQHKKDGESRKFDGSSMGPQMSLRSLEQIIGYNKELGINITKLSDGAGNALKYTINETMMRVELPATLAPGASFVFEVGWNYNMPDRMSIVGGRGGYEYFPEDKNYIYTVAQWFPRMAVYSDFQGWQNKQFTGRGEFALTFGDYKVNITAPENHVIGATGECLNYDRILSPKQLERWKAAQTSREPIEIVNLNEAKEAMKTKKSGKKTWIYHAENVRDFAFVSSPRLVWDAMGTDVEAKQVMAMSYYGPEAYPLYNPYSTKVIAQTLQTYSKHSIAYPYPVAISVEAANGMEYPMICFNYGRAEKDGTYSEGIKNGMISVIIHEVGHNFFPMIINSDERQWSWMDEGLNTFLQYLTEQAWDNNYPSSRGPAHKIVDYMKMPKDQLEPIMTNSENIINFGPNAYAKPATALNILRETVMGRELFDYAFKEYARRWAFKHPQPADFFRTMEDASAVDLDWFWRGWFYGIDPVDVSIENMKAYRMDSKNPERENTIAKKEFNRDLTDVGRTRNRNEKMDFAVDRDPALKDFYSKWDRFEITGEAKQNFKAYYNSLTTAEKAIYDQNFKFYEVTFKNKGGLVSPLILEWTFEDGSKETERISAYIWRKNENEVTKVFAKKKAVASLKLDPDRETADIDETNNAWPRQYLPGKFELFKNQQPARGASSGGNPMQKRDGRSASTTN